MDKILGIIAEYNPFHNGHKYQIKKAKEISKAKYVICLISSNFVQRGEASIYSSYERAKMALKNGADAVFEMPAYFSSSSAEYFAAYGVDFFSKLGLDYISFGVESATFDELNLISDILINEDIDFKYNINKNIKSGLTYPRARQEALKESLKQNNKNAKLDNLFSPNNILAIEYTKAIKKLNSKLEPIIITRTSNNYNKKTLDTDGFSSATSIRKEIYSKNFKALNSSIPKNISSYLTTLNPINRDDFFTALIILIKKLQFENFDFNTILDISPDLANTFKKLDTKISNYENLILHLKSKQYTYTRISRILSHILLNITKYEFEALKKENINYARLLGFKKEHKEVLNLMKKKSSLHFITKTKDYKSKLSNSSLYLYKHNLFCEDLYENIYFNKYKIPLKKDLIIE